MHAECVPLTAQHLADAFSLSSIAGWNQTLDDWQLLLELSCECYGVEIDECLAATATLVCYGQQLSWIGMVLTHPDYRRQGFARRLVGRLMQRAKSLGVHTLKLDATDDGRPLYETFGFQAEQPIERWQLSPQSGVPGRVTTGAPQYDLDAAACGYDRRHVLARLAARSTAVADASGYALSRPGRTNRYLGPCVAATHATARKLIEETIACHPGDGWLWDLFPGNESAVAIARDLGFECARKLTRMTWGRELHGRDTRLYAIAGFELG